MKPLAIVLALLATPSFAQSDCLPYDDLAPMMTQSGARLAASAIMDTDDGFLPIEFWRNGNGEWIMFALPPNGAASLIVGGPVFNLIEVGL
jgi:hypothetical protein